MQLDVMDVWWLGAKEIDGLWRAAIDCDMTGETEQQKQNVCNEVGS